MKNFSLIFKPLKLLIIVFSIYLCGCVALFGWDIHAPGMLSREFAQDIQVSPGRVALYIPEGTRQFLSSDKGTRLSDPQTYHIGEAYLPMLVEAFQHSFQEFVMMETLPTREIMSVYGIDYLVVVELKDFKNRKHLRWQGLDLHTETTIFKPDLYLLSRFETRGASEAPGVFAKKGGPEVNLNHALEGNLRSVITTLQDTIAMKGNV